MNTFKKGVLLAVLSYSMWGLLPLFWRLLRPVAPLQILAFRILCSLLFVGIILIKKQNGSFFRQFDDRRERFYIILAAVFVSANWGLFIWAVNSGHTIETSLGYYINPLFSIVLGLIFFKEKLSLVQWIAFASAASGVVILTLLDGFPWISIALALTFGIYGLLKKKIKTGALEGLGLETLSALPFALVLLFVPFASFFGESFELFGSLSALASQSPYIWLLLALAGPATALPLLSFAAAVRLIPLSSLGFIQIIMPTMTLLVGVFIFGEKFSGEHLAGFIFVWAGVVIYSISLIRDTLKKINRE